MTQEAEPQFLYLTTTGWKSGNAHEIEIWYVAYKGRYYLVSEHEYGSHWVQNVQHNSTVSFRVEGHTYQGSGRVVDAQAEPDLAREVSALMDAKYEWSTGLIVELAPSTPSLAP